MAEILYVDWDGLIYYDGKIKDYIDDKIKECLKFRGNVSYEELLQTSPSVDTVNTAFRLSEEFVTNEWFNKPGFAYPEGTIVYVAQFEDGTYKFDILVEPNGSSSGTDLTNYYNKQEVDNIVSELPTKDFVEKTVIDAIDSVEIDVSGLATREELELLETKEDAIAKLTAANKYTDDQISAIIGEGVGSDYIPFTDNYIVSTPLGGFNVNDSVQNMTISQIITKLLGLTLYVPPVKPGLPDNVPENTPEEIKNIIANELPAYVADGTGTIVEAEYQNYYKQMTTTESYVDSTGNYFYQIINDETGELEESGYQIDTVEDAELWMTIAIPTTITNFHVEQYNSRAAGDDKWQTVTYAFVAEDTQPIDGYTVYSVDGIDGGVTIRVVIDN